MLCWVTSCLLITLVTGHEYYNGRCPQFPPMENFQWSKFSGEWWVALKMNSRSYCIRNSYGVEDNERRVTETKLLPVIGRFGVPSGVTSEGTLAKHDTWSVDSEMSVSWNTGLLRSDQMMVSSMTYVIIDTDYTTRALVCQCQDLNLAFVNANRRSCEYLIVSPRELFSFLNFLNNCFRDPT